MVLVLGFLLSMLHFPDIRPCTYILGARNYFPSDFELAKTSVYITRMYGTLELRARFWNAQAIS